MKNFILFIFVLTAFVSCGGGESGTPVDKSKCTVTTDCETGFVCENLKCAEIICTPQTIECVDLLNFKQCNENGTAFTESQCGERKACKNNECVDKVCVKDETKCDETDFMHKKYKVCNALETGWSNQLLTCEGELICNPLNNQCVETVCEPNSIMCLTENDVIKSQKCQSDGKWFENSVVCTGDNPVCNENIGCENGICEANTEIKCIDSNNYQKCNERGTEFIETLISCGENNFCKSDINGDVCIETICRPNSKECSSKSGYKSCNATGEELSNEILCENSTVRDGLKTCYNGECKEECEIADLNKTNEGCSFYAVNIDNNDKTYTNTTNYEPSYYSIVVINPSEYPATVTITNNSGYSETRTINSEKSENFEMDTLTYLGYDSRNGGHRWRDDNSLAGSVFSSLGNYYISSDTPVIAYQFSPLGKSTSGSMEASLLFPLNSYSKNYKILTWNYFHFMEFGDTYQAPAMTTIVAKENETTVSLISKTQTLAGENIPALEVEGNFQKVLNAGEVLQIANANGDFSGSTIISNKSVGVFGAHRCTRIPTAKGYCDHLEEQLLPTDKWGKHYVVVKTKQRNLETEYYKLVVDQDGTIINFNPSIGGISTVTLNARQVYNFDTALSFEITSSKPVFLGQFMVSNSDNAGIGDPSFISIIPTEQFNDNYLFFVPNSTTENYITIIAENEADVYLDRVILDENLFTQTATTNYKQAIIPITQGVHFIAADKPLGVYVYGYDIWISYGYPAGMKLNTLQQ